MPLTLNPPPPTPVEPVTETLHGVPITDPYRWLEDQNSPRTREWLEDQTAYTQTYMDGIPCRERIRKRITELLKVDTISGPRKAGNRYFFLKRSSTQEQPSIIACDGRLGKETVLVDPAQRPESSVLSLEIVNVSEDGRFLAYGVRSRGEDSKIIEFMDVDSGQVFSDRLPLGLFCSLVFSKDGKGFYYSQETVNTSRPHYRAVHWHAFGTKLLDDVEVFTLGDNAGIHVFLLASPSGSCFGYLVIKVGDPLKYDFYLHNISAGAQPQRIIKDVEGRFSPVLLEDKLVAFTDWNSPNGQVVSIDFDRPAREHWRVVVREGDAKIENFGVAGNLVLVTYLDKLARRVEAFDLLGEKRAVLSPLGQGTADIIRCSSDAKEVFYQYTSFANPPAIFKYEIRSGHQALWFQTQVPFDSSSIEVKHVYYPSKDGTQVSMFLVYRKSELGFGPLPTLLTGYGGFGHSFTPQFSPLATFMIERGCLFAVAYVRGGGEFGEQWHQAGKRHKRQNAIDDFVAAAEWLVAQNHTTSERLAIAGGSNGGLLVAAALTQRPDLYRAVLCLGPLLDMLRYHKFDQANLWVEEYGSSENAADFVVLKSYSPYHQVKKGTPYPAVMFVSGDADTRCNPMHVRKMAAKLQSATSSHQHILIDYKPSRGHVPVQPLSRRIESVTDRVAFLCQELGVSI